MNTVICLSGGLDSTVLAAYLAHRGHTLRAVSYSYGQLHEEAELTAARAVATHLSIPHAVLDLTGVTSHMNPHSSRLLAAHPAGNVPNGHYTDTTMRATVVPGRNLLMIAAATAYAASHGAHSVALAAHSGDHPIYPDCRPEFLTATSNATTTGYGINLIHPFATRTKTDITRIGVELNAPLHLTWSCYNGRRAHCGTCGTCTERREAFQQAGLTDPTIYESEAA